MGNSDFRIGDKVIIPPTITGCGHDIQGRIEDIEYYMDYVFATVRYINPFMVNGRTGIVCHACQLVKM